jgi:hypothetical protein
MNIDAEFVEKFAKQMEDVLTATATRHGSPEAVYDAQIKAVIECRRILKELQRPKPQAYVICLNDVIKKVVTTDAATARSELEILRDKYYMENKDIFRDYRDYLNICIWNIQIAELLDVQA